MPFKQSDSFKQNRFFWKIFGLWPGKTENKYYKYFSFIFVFIILVAYTVLLILNLYFTPRKVDLLIHEFIFAFTEIAVSAKAFMIIFKRYKIIAVFNLLDCEEFLGTDDTGREIVKKYHSKHKIYFSIFTIFANLVFMLCITLPLIGWFLSKTLELPVCQYYFLSDETKSDYYVYIYIYLSFGMYVHMMYNVTSDTLIAGFLLLAIGQIKVLEHDLQNLKIEKDATGRKEDEHRLLGKLHKCVIRYRLLLKYCREFEDVISVAMFVQFGVGSAIICVVMCGMLLPSTVETTVFMAGYFFAMSLEVFVPAWLGSQLSYESQELMVAAYKSDWLPRPAAFKRSLRLFVECARHPVVVMELKMFPLALSTYLSIMKTAYSCFTLVRYFLNRQEHA